MPVCVCVKVVATSNEVAGRNARSPGRSDAFVSDPSGLRTVPGFGSGSDDNT